MQPCRRKSQSVTTICHCRDFRDLLTREKERSERHNRFFCVFGLSVDGLCGEDMAAEVRAELRASDYVFGLPQQGDAPVRIGVLLPETDHLGAQIVKKRLAFLFSIKGAAYHIGLAVYPDDATTPEHLLTHAFNGAADDAGMLSFRVA